MVKLRLKRMGSKKRPFYRIVAMTDNQPRSGQALAELGTYDPVHARFTVDEEATLGWLNDGAQMTETVHDLLHNRGILARWRGFAGIEREGVLSGAKPKRRKKLAAAAAAAAAQEGASASGAPASDGPAEGNAAP